MPCDPRNPEEGTRSPGIGLNDCELLSGCWVSNMDPLDKQPVLTGVTSLQFLLSNLTLTNYQDIIK